MTKKEKIAKLEKQMHSLFNLPIELMSNDVVAQYNILEKQWKDLTGWSKK